MSVGKTTHQFGLPSDQVLKSQTNNCEGAWLHWVGRLYKELFVLIKYMLGIKSSLQFLFHVCVASLLIALQYQIVVSILLRWPIAFSM